MAETIGLKAVIDLTQFNKASKQYNSSVAKMNTGTSKFVTSASKQFTSLGKSVLSIGAVAGGAALAGMTALGAGIVALGGASVKTAISFESAFAGVIKTTDGLTDSMGNLNVTGTALREGFVDLSKEVPIVFEELAAIGELGGQLGIGQDALLEFTETVAALGVSTNLTTEDAATGLARMGNIFNVASEEMGGNISQLGSTVVALGNNFATTERDILNFGLRLSGAGAIAGLTQADVLGIGAAMSSVGVEAEAGGTAVQKVLLAINNAVVGTTTGFVDNSEAISENVDRLTSLTGKMVALEAKAGLTAQQMLQMREEFIAAGGSAEEFGRQLGATERRQLFDAAIAVEKLKDETQLLRDLQGTPIDAGQLEKFASVAGLAATEFEERWKKDASEAFQLFVEGLGKQGDQAVNTLDELGLTDQRLIKAFLSLAGAGDLLGNTLDTANDAFADNTALADEAAKRYATTESQLLILKNTVRAVGDAIGSRFLPFINRLITAGKNLVNKFAGPIADAIDKKVIPALESIIKLGSDLFATFQAGGTAGLADALGLTPETTELISKISQSIQDLGLAITSFFLPGMEQLTAGGVLDAINVAIIFLNQNFEAFKGVILGVGAVLAGAAIAAILSGIITVMTAILSPIGLLIIAAGALGAAWATNWGNIRGVTASTISFITAIITALVATFQSAVLPPLQAAFADLTDTMAQLGIDWNDVWNAILQATTIVAIGIGVSIGIIIAKFVGFVAAIASGLATAISFLDDFGQVFTTIFAGIVTIVDGTIKFIQALIAGEWAAAWAAFNQITQGAVTLFLGINDLMVTSVTAAFSTILSIITGFAQGVIDIFTNLSNTLVGNSIIPDMVASIIETFTSMVQPILDIFANLSGGITNLLGGLFGGGEGEGFTLDISILTEVLPEAIAIITLAVQNLFLAFATVNEQIAILLPESLFIFQEIFLIAFQQIMLTVELAIDVITRMNMLLILISTVTLPQLSASTVATTQMMITRFNAVNAVLRVTNALLVITAAKLVIVKSKGADAAETIRDEFTESANRIRSQLIPALIRVIKTLERLETQAKKAAQAINSITGTQEASVGATGIGFQGGTPSGHGALGLGFQVPPGFPNDSFPMRVESGEEVLVTPRGTSIESLIFSRLANLLGGRGVSGNTITNITNNFEMTVNTGASPQAVIGQFDVMQGMLGT